MKTAIKNLDDVVFEERNKNYGAFSLRKGYNKNVTNALFLAVLLFLGAISIPLIASYINRKIIINLETTYETSNLKIPVKTEIEEIKLQEQKNVEKVPAFTTPKVVIDSVDESSDLASLMEGSKNEEVSESNEDGALVIDENKNKSPIDFDVKEEPVIVSQILPTFIGGDDAMYKWLSDNIKYPQAAKEAGIQGKVIVTFIIEKDGSITGTQLLKDIGGGCGEEAIRVVKLMPKWREGRQGNSPVRFKFNLPIKFTLE